MDINLVLLDTIRDRLEAEFNATVALWAPRYEVEPFTIDRFDNDSTQYVEARIDLETLQTGEETIFPLMFCYLISAEDTRDEKFSTFSGDVVVGVDMVFGVESGSEGEQMFAGHRRLERMAMLAETSLLAVFNTDWYESGSAPLEYNGEITFEKSPIINGGPGYLKALNARLTFGINGQ